MTKTIKQIIKEVLDEMDGQTISERGQYRAILEGKLTSKLNHYVSGIKEEASHECFYPPLDPAIFNNPYANTTRRCPVCGKGEK